MISTNNFSIPVGKKGVWEVSIPSSKSLCNRAVHLASLAKGTSFLRNCLDAIDARVMIEAHKQLGAKVKAKDSCLEIMGHGGLFSASECSRNIHVSNAGTVGRFITAALSISDISFSVEGDPAMDLRPMAGLTELLQVLGACFVYKRKKGATPFQIKGSILENITSEKELYVPGNISSQFLSALMMIGPFFPKGLKLFFDKEMVSFPYVEMTKSLMEHFGAVCQEGDGFFKILPTGPYKPSIYEIEVDYSSASYFLSLAAIHGAEVLIRGAKKETLQGDQGLLGILEEMGCRISWSKRGLSLQGPQILKGVEVDMKAMTDLVPALVVVALFAEGSSVLKNLSHMKYKECDRIEALITELSKLGAHLYEEEGSLVIKPQKRHNGAVLKTYKDHRMAMAFSIAGTRIPGTIIQEPSCVQKTFPNFFETLAACL